MADEQEESISVTIEDCKRWSDDLNNRLEQIRANDGEDAYRQAFMAAFLLMWFAQSIADDEEAELKISKPGKGELN